METTSFYEGNQVILHGWARNDFIYSKFGNDYIWGGEGDDVIFGGLSEDTLLWPDSDHKQEQNVACSVSCYRTALGRMAKWSPLFANRLIC